MTVDSYVSEYGYCAINNIPLNDFISLMERLDKTSVIKALKGYKRVDFMACRFMRGEFAGWLSNASYGRGEDFFYYDGETTDWFDLNHSEHNFDPTLLNELL